MHSWLQSYFFQSGNSRNHVLRDVCSSLLHPMFQCASLPVFFAEQLQKQSDGDAGDRFQDIYALSSVIFINL